MNRHSFLKKTFVSLALLLPARAAFTPTFSTETSQCGPFTVSWSSTDTARAGPPFSLFLIPVNDAGAATADEPGRGGASLSLALHQDIPESAWDATTNTGSYKLDALPFRTGERFIVVMDDGFGFGTGGVSGIQTVGPNPAGTSCLGQTEQEANIRFALDTRQPPQCAALSITTAQTTSIRGFVPNGSAFSLELPAASTGDMITTWNVNVATGSSFVLVYAGSDGKYASSGLVQTAAGTSDECIANGPHSTGVSTGSSTSASRSSSSTSSRSSSTQSVPTSSNLSSRITGTSTGTSAPAAGSSSSSSNNGASGRTAGASLSMLLATVIGGVTFLS
ncbi:hypothetical protein M408DRAFT_329730 [Serendipita vermifera MAFF 305830]|uniref:Uncharacterized protein n=1 Tax=Serendipita vermifera MAFF 305830 TaxID=933852 RepID=A0A0C3B7N4_SERVB|nr:hypothetical protein M408DRAFT_329730 [Serendipita vermifera MAFF 305830]